MCCLVLFEHLVIMNQTVGVTMLPDPCSFSVRSCKPGDFAIRSDCENNYANHDSQILIHPPNQPYGIVLDIEFENM